MKYSKIAFFYFCLFNLLQFSSCAKIEKDQNGDKIALDSVSLYLQQFNDATSSDGNGLIYANKALSYVKKAEPDTVQTNNIEKILNYKVGVFRNLNELDSVITTYNTLLKIALQKNDSATIAYQYFLLGYYHQIKQQKDSAFVNYKLAKDLYLKLNDSVKVGESLVYMAMIQSDFGDLVGSDKTAIQALKHLDEDNIVYLTTVYNCIAISAKKQHDYLEAIYWYDKAIEVSTDEMLKNLYLNNKANAYRSLKEYDKAIEILSNLKKDTLLNNDIKHKARVIDNLAYTKWLANEDEEVLNDFLLVMNMRIQDEDLFGLIGSYAHLSDYYKKKNPTTALEYAEKMYQASIIKKIPQDQLEALQRLIELENSNKAKAYYQRYVQLSDSLNKAEKSALNKFVKLEYDSEKNREENLQLKITTSEKELEIQKGKTNNILLFTSGSTIFISLLFFIYYKRKKNQIEKRVEVYKTEERIAKKIHDEVANNMVNIMNKVQYTENPKEALLDDLEKVYLLTRDISHQNNSIETGAHFEPFLKSMLTSFNSDTTTVILKDIQKVEMASIAKEKQIELYRILQELMVNMRKHSEATLVAITFKNVDSHISINYSDNGKGLDLKELKFKNGLKNLETRIKSISGTISFETSIHNGFKAAISFKK